MKKRVLLLIFLFQFSVIVAGEKMSDPFGFEGDSLEASGEPESSASIYHIDEDRLPIFIKNAIAGDVKASFKLYQYYMFSNHDIKETRKWLLKSAELGDAVSQYNIAVQYFDENDYKNAFFWGGKAKENGVEEAARLLSDIKKAR